MEEAALESLAAIVVIMLIVGFFGYTKAPRHWQNKTGFLLIVFGWVPVGIAVLSLLKHPTIIFPALFILGIVLATRKR